MFKQFLFLAIICLSNFRPSNAQDADIEPLPRIDKEFLVVVHTIAGPDSTLGIDLSTIETMISGSSASFSEIGVSFKVCEHRTIYNFNYNNANAEAREEFLIKHHIKNRINVFMVDNLAEPEACGLASLRGIQLSGKVGLFLEKGCVNIGVITHEFGHYFGLRHTFDTEQGAELADRSNCQTAGDQICDTPADPYIDPSDLDDYITDCEFTGTQKDTNGDYYNPHVGNVMSYYGCSCGFTKGQLRKMVETYKANPEKW